MAFNNVAVYNETSGSDSGDVSIYVHDNLDYATQALKDGEQYVEIAVQKASNAIIGMINQKMKSHLTLHDPLKIPFPKE